MLRLFKAQPFDSIGRILVDGEYHVPWNGFADFKLCRFLSGDQKNHHRNGWQAKIESFFFHSSSLFAAITAIVKSTTLFIQFIFAGIICAMANSFYFPTRSATTVRIHNNAIIINLYSISWSKKKISHNIETNGVNCLRNKCNRHVHNSFVCHQNGALLKYLWRMEFLF